VEVWRVVSEDERGLRGRRALQSDDGEGLA